MILSQLLNVIESHQTAARANVGSSLDVVLRGLGSLPETKLLLKSLRRPRFGSTVAWVIMGRIQALAQQESDVLLENPNDVALLAYLWMLVAARSSQSQSAAVTVAKGQNLWWSARYARLVVGGRLELNENGADSSQVSEVHNDSGEMVVGLSLRGAGVSSLRPLVVSSIGASDSGRVDRENAADDKPRIVIARTLSSGNVEDKQ